MLRRRGAACPVPPAPVKGAESIGDAARGAIGDAARGAGGPISVTPFRLEHGEIDALGLRIGDVAYTPDLIGMPPESEPFFEGLHLWIVDALRHKPHPSHFSFAEALAAIRRFRPKRAVLTDLHDDLDYATLRAEVPAGVEPASDGMALPFA